jgi:hypothetical protein
MCGGASAAVLHYDYALRTAWLDSLSGELAPGAWAICAPHAEGLKVPSGWTLVDRGAPAALSAKANHDSRAHSEVGYRPPLAV